LVGFGIFDRKVSLKFSKFSYKIFLTKLFDQKFQSLPSFMEIPFNRIVSLKNIFFEKFNETFKFQIPEPTKIQQNKRFNEK
jgi:hypothetical protein